MAERQQNTILSEDEICDRHELQLVDNDSGHGSYSDDEISFDVIDMAKKIIAMQEQTRNDGVYAVRRKKVLALEDSIREALGNANDHIQKINRQYTPVKDILRAIAIMLTEEEQLEEESSSDGQESINEEGVSNVMLVNEQLKSLPFDLPASFDGPLTMNEIIELLPQLRKCAKLLSGKLRQATETVAVSNGRLKLIDEYKIYLTEREEGVRAKLGSLAKIAMTLENPQDPNDIPEEVIDKDKTEILPLENHFLDIGDNRSINDGDLATVKLDVRSFQASNQTKASQFSIHEDVLPKAELTPKRRIFKRN